MKNDIFKPVKSYILKSVLTERVKRVNQEIRRRDRVIRIFPNDLSVLRLMGALLIEQHDRLPRD